MIKAISMLLLCSLILQVTAQQFDVKDYSLDPHELAGIGQNYTGWGFIGQDGTNTFYVVKAQFKSMLIKFNAHQELEVKREITKKIDDDHVVNQPKVYCLNGKLWVVGSTPIKKSTFQIVGRQVDKSTLEYIGPVKVFDEEIKGAYAKLRANNLSVLKPAAGNCLLLIDGAPDNENIKVVNSDFEVIRNDIKFNLSYGYKTDFTDDETYSTTKFIIPSAYYMIISSVLVDGKGNLFINFHIRGQNNKVAAFIKNNAPVESGLDEDKDTRSFTTLQEGPDGRIFCSGYYVEKDSILPHAIVMAEISPESGKLVTLKRSNINDRMAKELAPHDEPIFFGSGGFDRYNVHTALIDNSGLYLAFEHNISVPKRSGNVDWSYVDCLQIGMVKLDFDGRIAWQSIIPRWLRESYSGSGSIGLALRNDNCYIFYNDRASNAEVKNLKEMKYAYPDVNKQYAIVRKDQMGALVCARIDADGEVKRKVIDEYKEPVIVHANENIQLDDDRVLLGTYFSDKRNVQHIFSKLTLVTMQGER